MSGQGAGEQNIEAFSLTVFSPSMAPPCTCHGGTGRRAYAFCHAAGVWHPPSCHSLLAVLWGIAPHEVEAPALKAKLGVQPAQPVGERLAQLRVVVI